MLKDLIKEGGLYTLANLLTKGVSLLLLPFYADYFTAAEYGILAMLGISGAVSAAIFSFQIYQGVGRYITQKEISHRSQQEIGSSGLWFTVISYLLFLALALLFKDQIIHILSEDQRIEDSTYIWSLFAIALNGVFNVLSVQLKFLRKTKEFSLTTFLNAILNIGFILLFALGFDYRIDSVYMATIVVVPLLILLQVYFLKDYLIFYISKAELKKMMRFSAPLIPAALAYLILNLTDRVFIKEMSGSLAEVGIYDMAFKFSAIVSIIIMSFQSALAPLIYEKHENPDTPKSLGEIMRLFIGIGTLGILCLAFFSYETLYIFTQPKYYEASSIMPLFYLSILVTGFGMFSPGLHLKKKTKLVPLIVIIAAGINIGLNYWLIPIHGLFGAALATLASTIFNYFVFFIISQRLYFIPFQRMKSLITISIFLGIFFFGSYLNYFFDLGYRIQWLFKIGLIILYLIFLLQTKFISFDQIKNQIIRKKA